MNQTEMELKLVHKVWSRLLFLSHRLHDHRYHHVKIRAMLQKGVRKVLAELQIHQQLPLHTENYPRHQKEVLLHLYRRLLEDLLLLYLADHRQDLHLRFLKDKHSL